jgi:hypothetical protein
MWIDPLVEEIRKRRQELMAEFDYDPQKFLENIKNERRKYSHKLVYSTNKHEIVLS